MVTDRTRLRHGRVEVGGTGRIGVRPRAKQEWRPYRRRFVDGTAQWAIVVCIGRTTGRVAVVVMVMRMSLKESGR